MNKILIFILFVIFCGACSKTFTGPNVSDIKSSLGHEDIKNIGDGQLQSGWGPGGNPESIGIHNGELKYLIVKIDYLNPAFIREDKYPGFYIGQQMQYQVRVKNIGNLTFEHIDVIATHEYFETDTINRWWVALDDIYSFQKGQSMPGESSKTWFDITLGPGDEVVLSDIYTPPYNTANGLDQTHIKIKHTNEGPEHAALLYDNPIAGVFCPPPPHL